jgi:NAD(P)-dependent dehydrogenase (short-subunit alcohol dehydrogenase family)
MVRPLLLTRAALKGPHRVRCDHQGKCCGHQERHALASAPFELGRVRRQRRICRGHLGPDESCYVVRAALIAPHWFASAYSASKHAVVGMTRVAAKDYGPDNIRCALQYASFHLTARQIQCGPANV